ncbi:related to RNA-directed RNA polymerase [Ustilago bromivora]|uniref:RNA-dependent RNA polymerase n=1 Tax=Ustilago bromivora TaxID=307758 RepID=A0A8H8TRH6_9BASI|nr:related to RNA-directed RNA polymerase [Ustilago bromivora]
MSFLPRDVRSYGTAFINPKSLNNGKTAGRASGRDGRVEAHTTKNATGQVGAIFLFELKQNPQFASVSSNSPDHGYKPPSRLIRLSFAADAHGLKAAYQLDDVLDSLLASYQRINMRQIQMAQDSNSGFIESFFNRSKKLNIELAFVRESLLRNELVSISALNKEINHRLEDMIHQGNQQLALRALKKFVAKLELRQERGKDEEQGNKKTARLFEESRAETESNTSRDLFADLDSFLATVDDVYSPMLHIDVTPTRVLLHGPHYHVSNRVIRSYPNHWHHFARVTFTNEDRDLATSIRPNYGFDDSERYIQLRVLNVLLHGLNVAGRHWDLLAWSYSSMSTHTVWFVTPFVDNNGQRIDANVIRSRLGDFSDVIRSPTLYGARLSQAFSATARTISVPASHINAKPDKVSEQGMPYTDGVGQISPELMAEVSTSFLAAHGEGRKRKLLKAAAPSAIQMRLGGSKGVLAVNPRLRGKVLIIRPSMTKFGSPHQDLEVANASTRARPAKLNRPLINALEDRGVPASTFMEIQDEAITLIGRARSDFQAAARLCSAFSFGTGCNLRSLFQKLHSLGLGGKTVHVDSFFLVIAKSVTAAALGDMKRKARIPTRGVTMLGIADEFSLLKEGEVFAQVESVESGKVTRRILVGRNLIGRSPTVDPADVAMVKCVKPPPGHPLLQLRNVIVFDTCSRDQPLPRRLGGGDCDGDLYTIYEDDRLFTKAQQSAMAFHPKIALAELSRDCGSYELALFFTQFMLNDFIGLVSSTHLRIADISELGSHDSRCKTLARLHSQATDFKKTGYAVDRSQMPRHREPIIPDFLAQGEKREGKLVYSSSRALGYLYRAVSWQQTDTPSLDRSTDPETGLVTVGAADCFDENDKQASEFGSAMSSILEKGIDSQPVRASSLRATLDTGVRPLTEGTGEARPGASGETETATASPWAFKDVTFPQLLEKIRWSNSNFLEQCVHQEDKDASVVEGHRYISVFQHFTRELRQVSRMIASYHPDVDRPWDGLSGAEAPLGGTLLVSEVHLLTGRLPWSKVNKKKRDESNNTLLDNMRALCTMLRKDISSISIRNAFGGTASSVDTHSLSNGNAEDQGQITVDGGSEVKMKEDGEASAPGSQTPRFGATRVSGNGSIQAPYELLSDDDDAMSISSDSTIDVVTVRPANATIQIYPDGSGTNAGPAQAAADAVLPGVNNSMVLQAVSTTTLPLRTTTKTKKAKSPNIYGYNTFMLTLAMHLLSMLDTLKHLYRNPSLRSVYQRRRANSVASSASTQDTTGSSTANDLRTGESGRIDRVAMQLDVQGNFDHLYGSDEYEYDDDEVEGRLDRNYSLTADAMSALDLGTVLLDSGANDGRND